jgi:glycine/D-amino acid oxidase-like deaminating enzyme
VREEQRSGDPARTRYDAVIVGAGALGLASAYHLVRRHPELSILVVEARSGPGEGSMGASTAMVRDVFSAPDNQLLARNSVAFYRQLMEDHEDLRRPLPLIDLYGYLWLLPEPLLREYRSIVARSGGSIDSEFVGLEELRSCPGLEVTPARWFEGDGANPPEPIAGGLFGRNCGAVAPEMLARFYYEEARRDGVEFRFDTCVQRLSFEGRDEILLHEPSKMPFAFQEQMRGRLRVAALKLGDGSSVLTDRVIVAAGAWTEKILHPLGIATACSPRPQTLFSVSGPVVEELLRWQPPVHPVDRPDGTARFPFLILPTGAALKPIFRQRQLWVSYADHAAHPVGVREDPGRDGRLDYSMAAMGNREALATDVLPAIAPYLPRFDTTGVRLENTWGGYYHCSIDGIPILDEEYGVIFVGGDSGSGVMKADSLGRLVVARYEGRREASLFSGDSFPLGHLSLGHRTGQVEQIIL